MSLPDPHPPPPKKKAHPPNRACLGACTTGEMKHEKLFQRTMTMCKQVFLEEIMVMVMVLLLVRRKLSEDHVCFFFSRTGRSAGPNT